MMPITNLKLQTLRQLARDRRCAEPIPAPEAGESDFVSTGLAPLDRLLPGGGLPRGGITEWLLQTEGSGAETLVFCALRQALMSGGVLVVVDSSREFYPPAASRMGIDLERTIVIRPRPGKDTLWSIEQSLRCPEVAGVVCWPSALDPVASRRLQVAAEAGRGIGFLIRPARFRKQPSWASVKLIVDSLPSVASKSAPDAPREFSRRGRPRDKPPPLFRQSGRRMRVTLLYHRGGAGGDVVEFEIGGEEDALHLASRVADPASSPCAAGA